MIISYNIAYDVPELGGRVFGCSEIFTCKVFRQFSDMLRNPESIKVLMDFAEEHYVPVSSIAILVNIDNIHRFTIRMKNVREYKVAVDDYIQDKREERDRKERRNEL